MSGLESTPPPPDLLEPPESPFRKLKRAISVEAEGSSCDAGGRGAAVGGGSGSESRGDDEHDGEESGAQSGIHMRESMYVKLFDEMIITVLESEEYLFTPREAWILRHILSLPYEPHYLLTRLLLRRAGKVFAVSSLVDAYSSEVGEEGVKRAANVLGWELELPESITEAEEDQEESQGAEFGQGSSSRPAAAPSRSSPTKLPPASSKVPQVNSTSARPWADLPTGLSKEEEAADPDLAEAMRQSAWADQTGLTVDAYLAVIGGSTTESSAAGPSCSVTVPGDEEAVPTEMEELLQDCAEDPRLTAKFSLRPLPSAPIMRLGHDESQLTLRDLMTCVPTDELRKVARGRKIPPSLLATRESTTKALLDVARRQTTLNFGGYTGKGKGKARDTGPAIGTRTSEHLIAAQLLPLVGGHVLQVNRELHALVARVNLVFSRTPPVSMSQPALLLPPILVQSNKRHYPLYDTPKRSRIWETREDMLIWERAVSWEVLVSEAMGDIWAQVRQGGAGASIFAPRGQPMSRVECGKIVRKVWEEVWPIWKAMVAVDVPPATGVVGDRFRTEHVLTRVVHKGAEALGVLHEYDLECEVLRALLGQRRWRRGKRGAWYDRLALVLMTHYRGIPTVEERTMKLEDATQVCIDGLLDDDTHLIYRPGLSRRLTRLENKLNLPPEERHISFAELLTSETREVVAVRSAQNVGAPKRISGGGDDDIVDVEDEKPQYQQVGKSAWAGRDSEVTVEGWVLEWWEDRGYQGYHAESSILTTLFALLMWPVLFHPLPGAFETLYQTAPLDLGEDGFSRARREIMDARLDAMQDTAAALEMLRETDTRERPRGTWAVGLSWDFGAQELEEILECIGGNALATICRMLGEEYRHRSSGVPDLIVWNYPDREARFVEVKGPGDNLSETQKIWIDVLLGAGVPVEVCRVKDKDKEEEDRRAREDKEKERAARAAAKEKAKTKGKGKAASTPTAKRASASDKDDAYTPPTSTRAAAAAAKSPVINHSPTTRASLRRNASKASAGGSSRDEPIVLDDSDDEDATPKKRRKV